MAALVQAGGHGYYSVWSASSMPSGLQRLQSATITTTITTAHTARAELTRDSSGTDTEINPYCKVSGAPRLQCHHALQPEYARVPRHLWWLRSSEILVLRATLARHRNGSESYAVQSWRQRRRSSSSNSIILPGTGLSEKRVSVADIARIDRVTRNRVSRVI
ncbi:hypothetical protein EJ05DRAFT_279538 [Pseudovirgaria hyperparasitica]|uniref:Uncharacterized protein n=1 Tax=Pseudovirgaria hyperparasitica TaxID=470096 RepID=A0A6A6WDR1_9PEZI|nr:uncharacterized protein EJ05DRAFT_279538 [Pseudovirgaria hyperparasitica]KAF2760319.1 hypothetical protein EJ05DRAFT_279538 [Pseudovirgaria hyperparasitica]